MPNGCARLVSLLFLLSLGACRADASHAPSDSATQSQTSDGSVDIAHAPYRAENVANAGSVTGHVLAAGAIPTGGSSESDSALAIASADSTTDCRRRPEEAIVHSGNGIGDAVVWIAGVTTGKALPVERRLEVTQVGCVLSPRVQTAVTGSTVDVRNADIGLHFIAARDVGATSTRSLDRFNDDGQVVPDDKLARTPGMIELQCRQHPATKAFVAVFDHPYATVSAANGTFRIDSLPPGHYKLMVWHERGGQPVATDVTVAPNESAQVDVKIALR